MRISLGTVLFLCCLPRTALAQDSQKRLTVAVSPGDTGKAVIAALEFLQRITRDTVVLANCTMDRTSTDSTQFPMVVVGASAIRLPPSRAGQRTFCVPGAVRRSVGAFVYVESIREGRRDVTLPLWDQVNFEINVQVQYGLATREWQTLIVRSGSFRPTEKNVEVESWRVNSWQITGWRTH